MIPHEGQLGGGHQHEPGKLVVMHTQTGKVVQSLDSVGGVDNVDFDSATGRIYFTGTTGTVVVFKEVDPDHVELLGKVPTGAIAKSGLWVPEEKRFHSAVPLHYILTPPRATNDIHGDLRKELAIVERRREGRQPAHPFQFNRRRGALDGVRLRGVSARQRNRERGQSG